MRENLLLNPQDLWIIQSLQKYKSNEQVNTAIPENIYWHDATTFMLAIAYDLYFEQVWHNDSY